MNKSKITSISIKSAVILGVSGFVLGFIGPMIIAPEANQGPMLGIFITGPAGFLFGGIIGAVVETIHQYGEALESSRISGMVPRVWNRVLWLSGFLAGVIIAVGIIYIPWHESKYSRIVKSSNDLVKRDKAITQLSVRTFSDDDLFKLKQFGHLDYLDFYTGWGIQEAKITDAGLKILSELALPNLKCLMLGYCNKITDNGIEYLTKIKTLNYLSLVSCSSITDVGLEKLTLLTGLETLDLRGCKGITDRGLINLKAMKNLKEVMLGGCPNISSEGIEELRTYLPNSKINKDDQEWSQHIK